MDVNIWFWIGFNAVVVLLLLVDLLVFQRESHAISLKEAGLWSAFWILLSLAFCGGIYLYAGSTPALEFLTAYVVEKSLSVDNIFVFVVIFMYFEVAPKYQHRVLFWGILGALIMRAFFILLGVEAIQRFPWVVYIFGAMLIYTGIRMALQQGDDHIDFENNRFLKLLRRILPLTDEYSGGDFFVRKAGKMLATPLFLVLLVVEGVDLIFAVDSIPAVLAVTRDPFIAYTSNIAAILGLRALYFLLAGVVDMFRFLQLGLAAILTFVGIKMLLTGVPTLLELLGIESIPAFGIESVHDMHVHIPVSISLSIILGTLALSIVLSLIIPDKSVDTDNAVEAAKGMRTVSK